MVKKVRKFIVFVLFSMFFQLLNGKTTEDQRTVRLGIPSAEARCCPAGSTFLDARGECCGPWNNIDMDGNCY